MLAAKAWAWMRSDGRKIPLAQPLRIGLAGLILCLVSFVALSIYANWNSPRLLHFLADWIPFAATVFLAFLPSARELTHWLKRWGWRAGLIVTGLLWSLVLLHREELQEAKDLENSKQITTQIGQAVRQAVGESNTHSDGKFQEVEESVNKRLDQSDQSLTATFTTGIGKVGVPKPPEFAKLGFTLFKKDMMDTDFPILEMPVDRNEDGSFDVQYGVRNDSELQQAEQVEIWVEICEKCEFAQEPIGFDKPSGLAEKMRHKIIPAINPGVTVADNVVKIKLDDSLRSAFTVRAGISFRYTCKTCGKVQKTPDFFVDVPGVGGVISPIPRAPKTLLTLPSQ